MIMTNMPTNASVSEHATSYDPLSLWDKFGILTVSALFIFVTALLVICFIIPGCLCYRIVCGAENKQARLEKKKKLNGSGKSVTIGGKTVISYYGANGHQVSYSHTNGNKSECGDSTSLARDGALLRSSAPSTPTSAPPPALSRKEEQEGEQQAARRNQGAVGISTPSHLSDSDVILPERRTATRQDSGVSSISSRSSMSIGSALSALSLSKTDSPHHVSNRSSKSVGRHEKTVFPSISYTVAMAKKDMEKATITIFIEQARELPLRDYGAPCDPFIEVSLFRDRRSLRKKSRQVFAEFRTPVCKRDLNPKFMQEFTTDINLSDFKSFRLKLRVLDYDRHTKTSELGSYTMFLKEIKQLSHSEQGIPITSFLVHKKQEFGDLLFGMSYLPTAQRLSFSIIKAANLKYEAVVQDVSDFCPYVRILQMSSGKVVKKKKTTTKPGTKDPEFNETLNFELSVGQINSAVFLVLLSHRQSSVDLQEFDSSHEVSSGGSMSTSVNGGGSSDRSEPVSSGSRVTSPAPLGPSVLFTPSGKDSCLGRICVGSAAISSVGDKERAHWESVVASPRKVFSMWHTLQ